MMGWFDYLRSRFPVNHNERLGPNELPSDVLEDLINRDQDDQDQMRNSYNQDRTQGTFHHHSFHDVDKEFDDAFQQMDSMFKTFLGGGQMFGRFHGGHHSESDNERMDGFFNNGPMFGSGPIFEGSQGGSQSDHDDEDRVTRGFFATGPLFGGGSIFGGFHGDSPSDSGENENDIFKVFFGNGLSNEIFQGELSNGDGKTLREKMLNEDKDDQLAVTPFGNDDSDRFSFKFHSPFFGQTDRQTDIDIAKKGDLDLDKEIESGKSLDDILQDQEKSNSQIMQKSPLFSSVFKSSSVSKKINPDGSIETTTKRQDSDGNNEVITSRKIGEQTHTVTIKKNKAGEEEKIESFLNMDEKDLKGFDDQWNKGHDKSPRNQMLKSDSQSIIDNLPDAFSSWFKPKL